MGAPSHLAHGRRHNRRHLVAQSRTRAVFTAPRRRIGNSVVTHLPELAGSMD